MHYRRYVAPILFVAVMAGSVLGAINADAAPSQRCSAAGMRARPADQEGLTRKADDMRDAIRKAAVACRYQRLESLAFRGSNVFTYSYGHSSNPSGYWRRSEEGGEGTMEKLVRILDAPYVMGHQVYGKAGRHPRTFVWPSAMRRDPTRDDWKALEGIYSRSEIRSFRRHGYLGHRVFITARRGEWTVFVAGD